MERTPCFLLLDFNPRPPCGGRRPDLAGADEKKIISIHAPRVGGDGQPIPPRHRARDFNPRPPCGGRRVSHIITSSPLYHFNPRPPCGGRPWPCRWTPCAPSISIHAPRVGGDDHRPGRLQREQNFNPRPPCGGRPEPGYNSRNHHCISIHAPRVGGDAAGSLPRRGGGISIHAPRVGGDGFGPL